MADRAHERESTATVPYLPRSSLGPRRRFNEAVGRTGREGRCGHVKRLERPRFRLPSCACSLVLAMVASRQINISFPRSIISISRALLGNCRSSRSSLSVFKSDSPSREVRRFVAECGTNHPRWLLGRLNGSRRARLSCGNTEKAQTFKLNSLKGTQMEKAVVVFSGGPDSVAAALWAVENDYQPELLTFQFRNKASMGNYAQQ